MNLKQRFEGCILGGAIGDAWGSAYENVSNQNEDSDLFYPFGKPKEKINSWKLTDDTQLSLATAEVINKKTTFIPEDFVDSYLNLYRKQKIRGIGASTLKAMQELNFGAHWSQSGRRGEFAAGNGAAMRIAPLAFSDKVSNETLRDICCITHHNDEAYIGALCIVQALRLIIDKKWTGKENLIELIVHKIPDSRVRDRLILIDSLDNLDSIAQLGNSGYVVDSVPLAIAIANRVMEIGFKNALENLIEIGGDTDTNCSMAGQLMGALIGKDKIPSQLLSKLANLEEYDWIISTIKKFIN